MPSKKKKNKAKGRKAAGKGGSKYAEGDAAVEQKMGALDSQIQRLQIEEKRQSDDDEAAMLEEAIQLAAAEKKDIEAKEKENCKHGIIPLSRSQERFCRGYMQTVMNEYHAAAHRGEVDAIFWLTSAIDAADAKYANQQYVLMGPTRLATMQRIKSFFLSEGTKFILDGNYDDSRISAMAVKCFDCLSIAVQKEGKTVDPAAAPAKMMELSLADEHTLVQFFRKKISCSCLDEKYEEVRSITKMGYCWNDKCPLPGGIRRSKMLCCTQCRKFSYCSRECQMVDWPNHKEICRALFAERNAELVQKKGRDAT